MTKLWSYIPLHTKISQFRDILTANHLHGADATKSNLSQKNRHLSINLQNTQQFLAWNCIHFSYSILSHFWACTNVNYLLKMFGIYTSFWYHLHFIAFLFYLPTKMEFQVPT